MILKQILQKKVDVITGYSACAGINNNVHESVSKQHISQAFHLNYSHV